MTESVDICLGNLLTVYDNIILCFDSGVLRYWFIMKIYRINRNIAKFEKTDMILNIIP